MGKYRKINEKKLLKLVLEDGLSTSQVAKHFGVSRQAVHKRLQKMRDKTTAAIVSPRAVEAVDRQLKVMDQLVTINNEAHRLLKNCTITTR